MTGDAVLIAAQSGRALAQSARRAGLRPFVLDLFGDDDTRALAEGYRSVEGRFGTGRLGGDRVLAHLDALADLAGGSCLGIVLGSGFEGAPDLMARIGAGHRLLGATPDTVAVLKDPIAFAALCARLAIPHPEITMEPVSEARRWLLKRAGGSGGSHIRAATAGRAPPGAYFQARVAGRTHALAFLADGLGLEVVALTEQWSAPTPTRPYRYAGALERGSAEPPIVAASVLAGLIEGLTRLVPATGLRGLASADILVDGAEWWLTEVNPRPGATLDLLDRRPTPLLAAHIEAGLGRLIAVDPVPVDAAASEICYAARNYDPVPPIDWPDFVRDRPCAGSRVARYAPLCTLIATGADAAAARQTLQERADGLRARLDPREDRR